MSITFPDILVEEILGALSHETDVTVAYTESINLVDFSAVVIPVTKANKTIDTFEMAYRPLNEIDRMNWEACTSNSLALRRPCFLLLIWL